MMNKFRRNAKALSPIFATLILIAIAVIAGIVVYMFTSGYLASMAGSTTTLQDKLSVPGASLSSVVITNMGTKPVTVTAILLKNDVGATVQTRMINTASQAVAAGTTVNLNLATDSTGVFANPAANGAYTVTVTTAGGGSFVSAPFNYP